MPWVAPKTDFVNGDVLTATQMNNIGGDLAMFNGGTTGQVLSKASNANGDFAWTSETDPNAIPKTLIDAKGDLIAGSAADTAARLAVGTNGQVLTADSTTATGIKWATAAGGSLNEQIFTASGTFNVPTGTTKVWVEVRGGGGSGGAGSAGAGGSGGVLKNEQVTVTSGGTVTVTIGGGGAGVSGLTNGNAGSTTSFGALSAAGGDGGRRTIGTAGGNGGGNGGGVGADASGSPANGTAAAANTGAGGGGSNGGTSGAGGSGIVVVRWIA